MLKRSLGTLDHVDIFGLFVTIMSISDPNSSMMSVSQHGSSIMRSNSLDTNQLRDLKEDHLHDYVDP